MADKKITQLNNITGADLADADEFVVVDITADETKAITFDELKTAFDTGTGFVRITGDTMTGNLSFGDNDKAIFGAGSDLQIYHHSSSGNTYIDETGSGSFVLAADELYIQNATHTETKALFTTDGSVDLYYDNAKKFETTSTGIDVTGTVTADGLTVGTAGSDYAIKIYEGSGGEYYQIGVDSYGGLVFYNEATKVAEFTDASTFVTQGDVTVNGTVNADGLNIQNGSNAGITFDVSTNYSPVIKGSQSVSDLYLEAVGGGGFRVSTTDKPRLFIQNNGDISFYEDTGTTPKFHWDAADQRLGIGTSSPLDALHIASAVSTDYRGNVFLQDTTSMAAGVGGQLTFGGNYTSSGVATEWSAIQGTKSNSSDDYSGQIEFKTRKQGYALETKMTIDSSGKVGIGTTSPSATLDLTVPTGDGLLINSADIATIKMKNTGGGTSSWGFATTNLAASDFGIYQSNSAGGDPITAGTARMYFNSSGNVGIGETSPDAKLHIRDATDGGSSSTTSAIQFSRRNGGANDASIKMQHDGSDGVSNLQFHFGTSERMRIDSSGKLLVGGTSQADSTSISLNPQGYIYANAAHQQSGIFDREGSDGDILIFRKNGSAVGSISVLSSRLNIGTGDVAIRFDDTNNAIIPWNISTGGSSSNISFGDASDKFKDLYLSGNAYVGTSGFLSNNSGEYIKLDNVADTIEFSTSSAERMRIDSLGHLLVNCTSKISADQGEGFAVHANTSSAGSCMEVKNTGNPASNRDFIRFYNNSNGEAGSIEHNGTSSVAFLTSSDYRLKENVSYNFDATTRLKQLKPARFNFIADGTDKVVDGFLAHEVQSVVPEAISGTHNEVDTDGNPVYQSIDQSKLVPLLTAALQEALTEIESLKTRVEALEG